MTGRSEVETDPERIQGRDPGRDILDEVPLTLQSGDYTLVAIQHRAAEPCPLGVVIVVGGPQYRVGSHRQFLLLARFLAANDVPVLRFDYRGMGDSTGPLCGFEDVKADIRVAVDTLMQREPGLEGVVLWGLCDAASAILMHAADDPRVAGMILANPWVHTASGEAKTRLKHYYLARLVSRDLWRKLLSGRFAFRESLRDLGRYLHRALGPAREREGGGAPVPHFVDRMLSGLEHYRGQVFLILSGKDLVADEFRDLVASSRAWRRLVEHKVADRLELEDACHTFAHSRARQAVERQSLAWVRALAGLGSGSR